MQNYELDPSTRFADIADHVEHLDAHEIAHDQREILQEEAARRLTEVFSNRDGGIFDAKAAIAAERALMQIALAQINAEVGELQDITPEQLAEQMQIVYRSWLGSAERVFGEVFTPQRMLGRVVVNATMTLVQSFNGTYSDHRPLKKTVLAAFEAYMERSGASYKVPSLDPGQRNIDMGAALQDVMSDFWQQYNEVMFRVFDESNLGSRYIPSTRP